MTRPRILIVKTGTTDRDVVDQAGDYDHWFIRVLGPSTVVPAYADARLPEPAGFDGILLTGSRLSVRDEEPWMAELARWTLAAARRRPVLAVCFGHQLVGEALGGWVERNPRGGEYGTIDVELTAAGRTDPLFAGLPRVVRVQSTHRDALVRPPAGTTRLAGTNNTAWQAFAWGPRLRAVQFHPEMTEQAMRHLLAARHLTAPVTPTDHGLRILRNWLTHFASHASELR